jgi:hypothetical protein
MTHTEERMQHGRCLCGDVEWTVEGPLDRMTHCHCARCRKAHGTPFATYAFAPAAGMRMRGAEHVTRYASSPGFVRGFCGRCGSVVPSAEVDGHIEIPIGSLTTDPGVRPVAHIFVGSKLPWYAITDGLPQHATFEPGDDAPVLDTLPLPEPATSDGRRGSCLCGAVRFVLDGTPITARNCHCSRCRLARAAAHAANLMAPLDAIHITHGAERITSYKIPEARFFMQTFCRTCGGKVPRHDASRNVAIAPLGAFDDDPGLYPLEHIYVGSKAPWFAITDALPQHAEHLPSA